MTSYFYPWVVGLLYNISLDFLSLSVVYVRVKTKL